VSHGHHSGAGCKRQMECVDEQRPCTPTGAGTHMYVHTSICKCVCGLTPLAGLLGAFSTLISRYSNLCVTGSIPLPPESLSNHSSSFASHSEASAFYFGATFVGLTLSLQSDEFFCISIPLPLQYPLLTESSQRAQRLPLLPPVPS
jgi:hypothetical protein